MIPESRILLTIALVIEEQGNEPLTLAELTNLLCSCNRGVKPREAASVIHEWLRLEVLIPEENVYWVDPEVAIELVETVRPALTEAEREKWIKTRELLTSH